MPPIGVYLKSCPPLQGNNHILVCIDLTLVTLVYAGIINVKQGNTDYQGIKNDRSQVICADNVITTEILVV